MGVMLSLDRPRLARSRRQARHARRPDEQAWADALAAVLRDETPAAGGCLARLAKTVLAGWLPVQAGASRPVDGTLAGDRFGVNQFGVNQRAPGQLAPGQLAGDQFGVNQRAPGQLAPGQLAGDQFGAGQLAGDQLAADQLGAGQLAGDQLGAGQLAADQRAADRWECEPAGEPPASRAARTGSDLSGACLLGQCQDAPGAPACASATCTHDCHDWVPAPRAAGAPAA
ncbi:MAG: hypothetical protein ABSB01_06875 [Streptosporangiaceae bacterium]